MEVQTIIDIANEYREEMSDIPCPLDEEFHTQASEILKTLPEDIGDFSDGYHTFNELYKYRLLYNAAWFNELVKTVPVIKSKRHYSGEKCFNGNWFIVMADLPGIGQISNHYELKDWDLFKVPEVEKAWEWDGHTPQEVAIRISNYIKNS